jgi:2-C-methyl-D-erythritol 4-phosphate cytidylyltransferase
MPASHDLGVVIVAAGSGVRFGNAAKALAPLAGRPLLDWSLDLFSGCHDVGEIIVVAAEHTRDLCESLVALRTHARVVAGGVTRADSVRAGLAALAGGTAVVAVHDAARPLATRALLDRVLQAAREGGAAVPAVPVSDTLHARADDGTIASTPDRQGLWAAQTPQVARRDWLELAVARNRSTTDEGGLLAAAGFPVRLVDGDPHNLKITWPGDLLVAEALVAARVGVT